jgi:hypothetical protein
VSTKSSSETRKYSGDVSETVGDPESPRATLNLRVPMSKPVAMPAVSGRAI